jgi:type IV pilus assembly protein PilN
MAKINLLPWREERREERKKQFIMLCIVTALLALLAVFAVWFVLNQKLTDQEQANQLVISTNKSLNAQLKTLDGLEERRRAVIDRMKLIQGLEGQRPVTVRILDELARVLPRTVYLTKFTRSGNKFTIEGKADNPNSVAELLRNLEASAWFRNAFMNSFVAGDDKNPNRSSSVVPRPEASYGSFVITANIGSIANQSPTDAQNISIDGGAQ